MDYAAAVNAEIKDLFKAGADVVQIDEPYMQARPDKAREYRPRGAQRRARRRRRVRPPCISASATPRSSTSGRAAIRSCPARAAPCKQVSIETAQSRLDCSVLGDARGKKIMLGVIDLTDMSVETPETVAARIRRALPHVPAERIMIAPDCGMKYLPREVAFGKMKAMVAGANIVRRELTET